MISLCQKLFFGSKDKQLLCQLHLALTLIFSRLTCYLWADGSSWRDFLNLILTPLLQTFTGLMVY